MNFVNLSKLKTRSHIKISKLINRLVLLDYRLAKSYHIYKLYRNERKHEKTPILVYQMGKVGSQTVAKSLELAIKNRLIYHFHILRKKELSKYESWKKKSFPDIETGIKHVWLSKHIHTQIQKEKKYNRKKWKIITIVRDPVAHNISDFFQNLEIVSRSSNGQYVVKGVGSEISGAYDYECSISNHNVNNLVDIFFKKYPYDNPLKYYDIEFRDVLGVDIYANDSPKSNGYCIFKEKNYEILIIRLEDLNKCANQALKNFLDIKSFSLKNKNFGNRKEYSKIYKVFKDSIIFDQEYLDKVYGSKFSKHFYTKSEIEEFRSRWSHYNK